MSLYRFECDICEESRATSQVLKCVDCGRIVGWGCHGSRKNQTGHWDWDETTKIKLGVCKECQKNPPAEMKDEDFLDIE